MLAVLLLQACSLRGPEPLSALEQEAQRRRLLAMSDWQLRGRVAVKSEQGGGQGDLVWQQQGAQTRIRVSGPFGAGAYDIGWDPESLRVSSRNGEFSRSWTGHDAAEQFLAEQLGWSFPAVSSRYWLLGLADPGFPARETFSGDGRLAALQQNGWDIRYERHAEVAGLSMPAKIVMEKAAARLRIVIDRWEF